MSDATPSVSAVASCTCNASIRSLSASARARSPAMACSARCALPSAASARAVAASARVSAARRSVSAASARAVAASARSVGPFHLLALVASPPYGRYDTLSGAVARTVNRAYRPVDTPGRPDVRANEGAAARSHHLALYQRSAIVARLCPPAKPACTHPDSIGGKTEPFASLRVGQPFRHGSGPFVRTHVRSNVRVERSAYRSVASWSGSSCPSPYTSRRSRRKQNPGNRPGIASETRPMGAH